MTPMSKRCRAYVLACEAAMAQRPVGLPESEVRQVFVDFLRGGLVPTADEFRSELVRRWQMFTSRMALFSETEEAA